MSIGGGQESTSGAGDASATALHSAVEEHLRQMSEGVQGEAARSAGGIEAAASRVIGDARRALERTAAGESPNNLSDRERASLEAIVRVTGRPALRFLMGGLEFPAEDLGANQKWALIVGQMFDDIEGVAGSVGRVSIGSPSAASSQLGTAWRLGDDLVVTNRHVAREMAADGTALACTWTLRTDASYFVDFAVTHAGRPPKAFAITEIAFCAEDENVDAAVLRLSMQGAGLPPALGIDLDRTKLVEPVVRSDGTRFERGKDVYVVGHPFRSTAYSVSWMVFGDADGKKRWSPGEITDIDAPSALCVHDCSTLGGSSGSCIVSLASHAVVGMHFGGKNVDEITGRGDANLGLGFALLEDNRFRRILMAGQVV